MVVQIWSDIGFGGCREAGGWMPWLKEKAGMTGRRWRTVLFGRKTVKRFLKTEVRCCPICCSPGPVDAKIKSILCPPKIDVHVFRKRLALNF